MKHTPGPWLIGQPTMFCPTFTVFHKPFGLGDVAEVHGEANARLIAAAPEMLEALDKIACFAPGNGDVCEIIAKVARSAIAKATGDAA